MAPNPERQVGDLVQLIRGTTYKGALVGKPGPALLGLGSIVPGGGFRTGDFKTYGGECPEKLMLYTGDLYVSLKGATKDGEMIGSIARVPPQVASGRLTQDTVKLVFNTKFENLRSYLYWLLRTPQYRAYCAGHATGSAVVALSRDDFLSYPVPPLTAERELIVEVLERVDDKIELNRRMNETLEAMARAIFRDWFVDFGPTRAKAEGRTPYLAPEIWDLFPDALDDEDKPVGWAFDTLARLADTNAESWTARHHPPTVEYVDLSNTKWGNIDSTTLLDWEAAPSRARRVAKEGDTIVGTTRPGNGSFAYISRGGLTVSTGFAVLSPRVAMYRDAVYIAATSAENIERLANLADGHGGAYPAVKPNEVTDTSIAFPGGEVLAAFADLVSPIRERIEHAKTESHALSRTRDLLLPKLMSGEIRLRDAEEAMEAVV